MIPAHRLTPVVAPMPREVRSVIGTAQRLTRRAAILTLLAGPLGAQTIAITGGKVYPVSGPPIEHGTVLVKDGKILAVGASVAVPAGAQQIDATGKWVTPGLVDSYSNLGLVDVEFGAGPRESSAKGADGIAAAFESWLGLNPRSVMIQPAREEGVTTTAVWPQGGLVAGQLALVDLVNGTANDMLVRAPAAMVAQIGDDRSAGVGAKGELIGKLRTLLQDTRTYVANKAAYNRAQTRPFSAGRADLEAMIPVLDGRLPLLVTTDQASDIEAALQLAAEFKLRLIIGGGAEAWVVADKLAKAKVPVLTGAMNNIPSSFSALATRQENAAILRRAGVEVGLLGDAGGGDEDLFNIRNIRYEAGNAVAYGMSWDNALRAITLGPAQIFGIADRVGSLQVGKEANVVVWSGDPFEFANHAEVVLVRGERVTGRSRQDLLTDRYKTLPPTYGSP